MPPVQPMPMTTISTGGSFIAIDRLPSRHVGNADGVSGETFSVAEFLHVLRIVGRNAGKADHLPSGLVSVAAIDRIREHSLNDVVVEHVEERSAGEVTGERDFS